MINGLGRWYWFCIVLGAILGTMLAFAFGARAQMRDLYPPLSSPTMIVPLEPTWRSPGPTYVLPPPPAPRIEYPPLYTPPAPLTICTRYGTGTVCQ